MTSCNSCTHMISRELQILCSNYHFHATWWFTRFTTWFDILFFACMLFPTSNLLLLHRSWWFTNKFEVIISNFKCNIQIFCFLFSFDIMNVFLFWLFVFIKNSTNPMSLQIKNLRFKTMLDDQISQIANSNLFFINNKFLISPSSNVMV
jgi:hypothetical protein